MIYCCFDVQVGGREAEMSSRRSVQPQSPPADHGEPELAGIELVVAWLIFLLQVMLLRWVPIGLMLLPVYLVTDWLLEPNNSHSMVQVIAIICAVGTAMTMNEGFKSVTLKLFFAGTVLFGSLCFLVHFGIWSATVSGYLTSSFTIIFCLLGAFMSANIGKPGSSIVQRILMAVALTCPPMVCVVLWTTSNEKVFMWGVLLSVFASGLNVFFNKEASSLGLPARRRR